MTEHIVYIGLGSNLDSPAQQIKQALQRLASERYVLLSNCSHLYSSAPMGPSEQPDYVNAVCEIKTTLEPESLLDLTQDIENVHGRTRHGERWGPRTLDLDILLFGNLNIDTGRLTVPHYGMANREFVLVPLFEIAPDLIMPDGRTLAEWVAQCSITGLKRTEQVLLNDSKDVGEARY